MRTQAKTIEQIRAYRFLQQAAAASAHLHKLPEWCYVEHPQTKEPVIIFRGVEGYQPKRAEIDDVWVDEINGLLGVTQEQAQAMLYGSLFGWHARMADPDFWANDARFQADLKRKGKR